MWLPIDSIFLLVLSTVTFFTYAADKKKAQKGKWRTKEATLLGLSFIGGAVGGYLAMQLARHKTKQWYFHAVNLLGIVWQIGVLLWLILA